MTAAAGAEGDAARPMQTVLLNMLTPLLMAGGLSDPEAARRTIAAAVARYAAHDEAEWLTAAQIIGYAVSGLDSLRIAAGMTAPDTLIALRDNAARLAASAARAERSLA